MVSVGIIGCGHWGPNHIRVFSQLANSRSAVCADLDETRLKSIKASYPAINVVRDYKEILKDPSIDAVVIAVPTKYHYQFTKEALAAGKHVLGE